MNIFSLNNSNLRPKDNSDKQGPRRQKLPPLTQDEIQEAMEMFEMFDIDGGGTLSLRELALAMRTLGYKFTDEELDALMQDMDEDGNGEIDSKEFMMLLRKLKAKTRQDRAVKSFRTLDVNGDGYITADDLKIAMVKLQQDMTDHDIELMILGADGDKDGKVDFQDYLTVFDRMEP